MLISRLNVQYCELSLREFGYHYKFRLRLCSSIVHYRRDCRRWFLSWVFRSFPICSTTKQLVLWIFLSMKWRSGWATRAAHEIVESTKLCANIDNGLFIHFYWIWNNKIAMQTLEFHFVDYYLLLSLIQCASHTQYWRLVQYARTNRCLKRQPSSIGDNQTKICCFYRNNNYFVCITFVTRVLSVSEPMSVRVHAHHGENGSCCSDHSELTLLLEIVGEWVVDVLIA